MNDFSDPKRSISELIVQGAFKRDLKVHCNDEILSLLAQWQQRIPVSDPGCELFWIDKTQVLQMTYTGEADRYWPDADANMFTEALVRDVLYTDGICNIEEFEPLLYQINFKVVVMEETEYLMVLPYPTEAGNIAGIVVVCVNHYLRK